MLIFAYLSLLLKIFILINVIQWRKINHFNLLHASYVSILDAILSQLLLSLKKTLKFRCIFFVVQSISGNYVFFFFCRGCGGGVWGRCISRGDWEAMPRVLSKHPGESGIVQGKNRRNTSEVNNVNWVKCS